MSTAVSLHNKVPKLPNITTPEIKEKKKKKNENLLKLENVVKSKHFNVSIEKQVLFKDFSQKFSHWKSWQRKILLCKCTIESSFSLLVSLATAMEPVHHRDFQVINLGGFTSSLIRNFTVLKEDINQEGKESLSEINLKKQKDIDKTMSGTSSKTLPSPFELINLGENHEVSHLINHCHSKERRPDSLSTTDFMQNHQRKQLKSLGGLLKNSRRKNEPSLLSEYKHRSWWTLSSVSELHLETISKVTLLQSFKEISDQFISHFVKWSNAEKGDFYLNIFEFCSPEELIYLANCIQQRLKDINDIDRLPDKTMLDIFSYLDEDDLQVCSYVCKRWKLLANHNILWREKAYGLAAMYKQHAILHYLEAISVDLTWSDIYKELNEAVKELVIENVSTDSSSLSSNGIDETKYTSEMSIEENVDEAALPEYEIEFLHKTPVRTFSPNNNRDLFPEFPYEEAKEENVEGDVNKENGVENGERETVRTKKIVERVVNVTTIDDLQPDYAFDVRPKLVQPSNELGKIFPTKKLGDYIRVPIPGMKSLKRVRKLQGHLAGILSVQFDKKRVISGSADQTVRLWDIRSGRNFHKLEGHQGGVRCLQFDDKYIITGSWDMTVIIWHVVRFQVLHTITEHKGCVSCLEITDDFLITGSHDTTVCVFKKHTWDLVRKLRGHVGPISSMVLVSEDELLTGGHDMNVILWNFCRGIIKRRFQHRKSPILCVRFCGELIAAGTLDGSLIFWNKTNKTLEGVIKAHDGAVNAICFVATRFVTGGSDMLVKEWDIATCTCLRSLTGHTGPVVCVRASQKRIITGSADGTVRLWDMVCRLKQVGGPYDELNKIIIPAKVINENEWKRNHQKIKF